MTNQRLGKYEAVRLIGQGGSGAVYEAIDALLARRVAIKAIPLPTGNDRDLVKSRFIREARLTASLKHPNIIGIYDFFEQGESLYLVMEYLSGRSLDHVMAETPKSEWWDRFLPVLRQCARAIDYVHERGIVHGDIKPGNIMVSDGPPKILDFGLARIAHQTSVTQTGSIIGTVSYLAPEMLQNQEASPQADQYALAVIAYQLATGVFPFDAESAGATFYKILQETPVSVKELNPAISFAADQGILKALSKLPADRFPNCDAFLDQISPGEKTRLPAARLGEFTRAFTPGRAPQQHDAEAPQAVSVPPPAPVASPPVVSPGPALEPAAPSSPGLIRRMVDPAKKLFATLLFGKTMMQRMEIPRAPPPAPPAPAVLTPATSEQTVMLRRPAELRLEPRDLVSRQAAELTQLARAETFEPVVLLEGKWLPGVEGADATLLAFREAARYLVAARGASSPHNMLEHLTRAEAVLVAAGNQLLHSQTPAALEMPPTLQAWKDYTRAKLAEARQLVERQLPNPYRAGQPLRPDQGRMLFRGRDQVVQQIESILADGNQSGSIALLGPRRCGKTSLLQMLPALLPDCVCVFFDLQDNAVESTSAFFQALEHQAREQSRRDRRVELPPLPAGGSFSSATQWLQELDNLRGDHRILHCLDEFERLEDLFPGNRQDLLRLMGLFRGTIQHRRRLRLLVSGVAPFDELGQIWNDHFINVREIRVGHLDRPTAINLLMNPLSDFPAGAVPEAVAARIFERTGGQPYLLQLYGSLLISYLNQQERKSAVVEDVAQIEEEAMSQGAYYFRHSYESAPPEARRALEELAAGGNPDMPPKVRQWLLRRGLADNGELCIPVLGTFMRADLGLQ